MSLGSTMFFVRGANNSLVFGCTACGFGVSKLPSTKTHALLPNALQTLPTLPLGTGSSYAGTWRLVGQFGKALTNHTGALPSSTTSTQNKNRWVAVAHPFTYRFLLKPILTTQFSDVKQGL